MFKFVSKRKKYLILSFLSLALCIYSFSNEDFLKDAKNYCTKAILPVKSVIRKQVSNLEKLIYFGNEKLQKENELLKIKIYELEKENKNYTKLQNIVDKFTTNSQIERVLGFDQGIFASNILISYSRSNKTVVRDTKGLVGLVISINDNVAYVKTILATNLYVPAKNSKGTLMILHGTNSNLLESIEIKNVNNMSTNSTSVNNTSSASVSVGDVLYTSGEGGLFEQNIPIGIVKTVDLEQLYITATPIVDFKNLEFVILLNETK